MAVLKYDNFVVEVDALPAKSLAYLLQIGFSAAVSNSFSNAASKARKAGKSEEEIAVLSEALASKRVAAIVSGEVGTRDRATGARGDAVAREVAKVAREDIAARLAARGIKMPTGQKYDALLAKLSETLGDEWRIEAEQRIERRAAHSAVGGEVDDLLSDIIADADAGADAVEADADVR